eukprot:6198050-Pleurochrysis_carterae.AAC.2
MGLLRQGQPVDQVPGIACEATEDLEDEQCDLVSEPQRVLVLYLLERMGGYDDGRKQARLGESVSAV